LYADGGRLGALSAVQITDRYHLVSNLSEAVEREYPTIVDRRAKAVGADRNARTWKGK
jgi:hypothetical protein